MQGGLSAHALAAPMGGSVVSPEKVCIIFWAKKKKDLFHYLYLRDFDFYEITMWMNWCRDQEVQGHFCEAAFPLLQKPGKRFVFFFGCDFHPQCGMEVRVSAAQDSVFMSQSLADLISISNSLYIDWCRWLRNMMRSRRERCLKLWKEVQQQHRRHPPTRPSRSLQYGFWVSSVSTPAIRIWLGCSCCGKGCSWCLAPAIPLSGYAADRVLPFCR